jgi:TM2 domain-containing membrane protein YozV
MKNRSTTIVLALLLGGLGIHRFYLGKPLIGLLYLLFCWTFIPFLIGWIDAIVFAVMPDEKFNAKYNQPLHGQATAPPQQCIGCQAALTFNSTPNFGRGFLNDGQRVCRSCFSSIVKTHPSFGLKSKKDFSTATVLQILRPVQPTAVPAKDLPNPFTVKTSSDGLSTSMNIDLDPEKLIPYMQEQQRKRDQEIASFRYDPADV